MVSCSSMIAHLSEYMDGDATPELCLTIEHHLRGCRRCSAVYNSTRKLLIIAGDERIFELPAGFSVRLHRFLDHAMISGLPT